MADHSDDFEYWKRHFNEMKVGGLLGLQNPVITVLKQWQKDLDRIDPSGVKCQAFRSVYGRAPSPMELIGASIGFEKTQKVRSTDPPADAEIPHTLTIDLRAGTSSLSQDEIEPTAAVRTIQSTHGLENVETTQRTETRRLRHELWDAAEKVNPELNYRLVTKACGWKNITNVNRWKSANPSLKAPAAQKIERVLNRIIARVAD